MKIVGFLFLHRLYDTIQVNARVFSRHVVLELLLSSVTRVWIFFSTRFLMRPWDETYNYIWPKNNYNYVCKICIRQGIICLQKYFSICQFRTNSRTGTLKNEIVFMEPLRELFYLWKLIQNLLHLTLVFKIQWFNT